MQVFSLADPTNPVLLYTGPLDVNEVHDAYVRDNIAYLNCGFDGLRVYNFSSPTAPMYLQNMNLYQDQGYNHQGWLSPDGTKYVFGDETNGQRLKFCSVDPWSYQVDIENYFGTNFENNSVPHNIVLTDHYAYVAYYNEGFRIYNTIGAYPIEVAHYDTYAEESLFKMNGAWGVFVYPNSELLLVSDRQSGLYLFDFRDDLFLHQTEEEISVSPNPLISGNSITIRLNIDNVSDFYVELSTLAGAQLGCWRFTDQNFGEIPVELSGGYYFFNVIYTNYLGEQVGTVVKVNVI